MKIYINDLRYHIYYEEVTPTRLGYLFLHGKLFMDDKYSIGFLDYTTIAIL